MITLNYYKEHSNLVTFLLTIFVLGIIFGIVLGFQQDNLFKNDIIYNANNLKEALLTNKINNIFSHLGLVLLIIFSSIIVPLYFLNIIYLLFKGVTVGFNIYILTISFGFKGFICALLYNLFFNFLFIFLIIFILLKGNYFFKNTITYFFNKDKTILINSKKCLLAMLIISLLILINDIILFLTSSLILPKIFLLLG